MKMCVCVCVWGGIYGEHGTKCLTYHKGYKEITYPFVVTPPSLPIEFVFPLIWQVKGGMR